MDQASILVGHLVLPDEWLQQQAPQSLQRQWLTSGEADRFQELRQSADRWRLLAGRFLMRHCIREFYGIDFALFKYGDHNKPSLTQPGMTPATSAKHLDVNLTHDRHHVMAAFSAANDVGIDVTTLTDFSIWAEFAEDYLAAEEVAWVQKAPANEQPLRASRLWTLKEAILKSTGHGLDIDPREILLAPGTVCPILRLPSGLPPVGAFALHEWQIDAQTRGALASVQRPVASNEIATPIPPPPLRIVDIPAQKLMPEPFKKEKSCFALA